MDKSFYSALTEKSLLGKIFSEDVCRQILISKEIEILLLLDAAFQVRKRFAGKDVTIHVINNVQNGYCSEDCHYCAQSKISKAVIEEYPLKSNLEILAEAKRAYDLGAYRYCMVYAGRSPSEERIERLTGVIREIKSKYPIQVCVSPGIINYEDLKKLKKVGLDRLNHNLNTSEKFYSKICTTHTYQDRMNTLTAAKEAGLELCSGVIIGMGEGVVDVIELALTLRKLKVSSIPVNFLLPIKGNMIANASGLTPEYCLRILCLYRFLNPDTEIRIAAGREFHLRSMEIMCLYPANSLFLDGYLNVKGSSTLKTLQMIKDAGFAIKSDHGLEEFLKKGERLPTECSTNSSKPFMKGLKDLRPQHL